MALTANRTGLEGMAHVFRRPMQPFRALARQVSRFISAQDGGAEFVEFAIVILPFLAVVIAILQISYFLFAQQTLQTAAVEFGRQFMTNQGPAQTRLSTGTVSLSQPPLSAISSVRF